VSRRKDRKEKRDRSRKRIGEEHVEGEKFYSPVPHFVISCFRWLVLS
jgi:hypothetical protein